MGSRGCPTQPSMFVMEVWPLWSNSVNRFLSVLLNNFDFLHKLMQDLKLEFLCLFGLHCSILPSIHPYHSNEGLSPETVYGPFHWVLGVSFYPGMYLENLQTEPPRNILIRGLNHLSWLISMPRSSFLTTLSLKGESSHPRVKANFSCFYQVSQAFGNWKIADELENWELSFLVQLV